MRFQLSRDRRQWLSDIGLALGLAIASIVPVFSAQDGTFVAWATLWSCVMCASIALRRVAPLIALLIISIAGIGMLLTLSIPLPSLLAVPVVTYSIARYQTWAAFPFVLASALFGSVAGPYTWGRSIDVHYRFLGTATMVLLCLAIVAVAYSTGRLIREQHLTEQLDREIATQRFTAARRYSEQATQLAAGRARVEIAQELHDVLAHSLSIIVVQAEGARALTTKRPEAAAEALTVIADTGRRSINEVRRIVSLMRGSDEIPDFGPTPSLAEIPALVDAAGERVNLTIGGDPPMVPDSLGLIVFRVVQESITNFLKHAGPTAECDVTLRYTPEMIVVAVRDDGMGIMSEPDGHGSGLPGMRERVLSVGGQFHAGPRPGGGYEVRAHVPMPSHLGKGWLRGD